MKEIPQSNIKWPDAMQQPPPGIYGYWWEDDKVVCIALIEGTNKKGLFREWMVELEKKNKIIYFPTVIGARLLDILRRNGYEDAYVYDKFSKDTIECMAKFPKVVV